ncbi:MAG: winged helix-turn-helix domain-containing protein [Kofleriaceae bacterium]
MVPDLPADAVVRFGAFELVVAEQALRKRGATVRLPAQPLRLLALLSARSGAIVSRAEIQRCLWPDGTVVDFDQSINHCVRQLRGVLDDSAVSPRWIETLPGRGYRFVAPAEIVSPTAEAAAAAPPEPAPAAAPPVDVQAPADDPSVRDPDVPTSPVGAGTSPAGARPRRVWAVAGLLGAAAAALLIAGRGRTPDAAGPVPAAAATRVMVVPFAALDTAADTPTDVAAAAVTAELTAQLGERYAGRLAVIAPSTAARFADAPLDAADVGRSLDVAYLVRGTVDDRADRRRVTAQVIRTRDQVQVWARTYDRPLDDGDDLTVPVAVDVATSLAVTVSPAPPPPAVDGPALAAYHRGLFHLGRLGDHHAAAARRALEEAVTTAPGFGRAWAALAKARARTAEVDGWAATRAAVERALALDPDGAEAHAVAGLVALYADWNPTAAIAHEQRALAANPSHAEALHQLASAYATLGRHRDAVATIAAAAMLDPQGTAVLGDVGWFHYLARDYAAADRACLYTLGYEPSYYWGHRCVILARIKGGDLAGAAAYARSRLADERAGLATASPAQVLERWWQQDLAHGQATGQLSLPDQAVDRLMLGDRDGALALLARGAELRVGWLLPFLTVDPAFDELRGDPRFKAVVAAVGI